MRNLRGRTESFFRQYPHRDDSRWNLEDLQKDFWLLILLYASQKLPGIESTRAI